VVRPSFGVGSAGRRPPRKGCDGRRNLRSVSGKLKATRRPEPHIFQLRLANRVGTPPVARACALSVPFYMRKEEIMAITRPEGPSGGAAVIGRTLPQLLSRGPKALSPTGGSAGIQASEPIRLFMLKAQDITDMDFVKKAVPVAWRYLILDQGPIAIADVKESSGLAAPSLGTLIRGPIAERLGQAAELAEEKYNADPNNYEVRILEIPSLYITTLWLHGPQDVFSRFLRERRAMPLMSMKIQHLSRG